LEPGQRLASQVSNKALAERVAEIVETFVDHAKPGTKLKYSEAVGMARVELALGRVLQSAKAAGHDAIDRGFYGRIQLKGPLINPSTNALYVNTDSIEGLFRSVVDSARYSKDHDSIIVDLLGFSPTQVDDFMRRIDLEKLPKPVHFIS
jgi:hypothetical protein